MPQRVPCPGCNRRVRVADELIGQPVQCPACKTIFLSEPEEEEVQEVLPGDEDDDFNDADHSGPPPKSGTRRQPQRRRPTQVDSWKAVRHGLARIGASFFTIMGTWVIVLLLFAFGFAVGMSVLEPTATMAIWVSASVLLLLGVIAMFTLIILGLTQCREAPQKNGCYKLATVSYHLVNASVIAALVVVIFVILTYLFVFTRAGPAAVLPGLLALLSGLLMALLLTAGLFCFVFFMRSVCVTVRAPGLAANCLFLMVVVPMMAPLGPTGIGAVFYLPQAFASSPEDLGPLVFLPMCCGVGGNLLPLAVALWLIITIFQVRAAVGRYLAGED